MAVSRHSTVGGVLVKTGTGIAAALELLGVPAGPVEIIETKHERPVFDDISGDAVPGDIQDTGIDYIIRMNLVSYDDAIVTKIAACAGQTVDGVAPAQGYFITGSGYGFRLLIDSTTDRPWNFTNAKLRSRGPKPSSEYQKLMLEFYAWGYVIPTATTAAGIVVANQVRT